MLDREDSVDPGRQDPHFDGKREGVYSDPAGKQFGVRSDAKEKKNPYNVTKLKKDPEMERFKRTLE
ncbi:hypothetical protein ACFO3D_13730 [Virgibacillus kekensis]|uniref:Cytosolic protein n=1 Tax=Virgibacillus kekensis TaxID=202261 RepID=A0ABV9DLN9_9BACI